MSCIAFDDCLLIDLYDSICLVNTLVHSFSYRDSTYGSMIQVQVAIVKDSNCWYRMDPEDRQLEVLEG